MFSLAWNESESAFRWKCWKFLSCATKYLQSFQTKELCHVNQTKYKSQAKMRNNEQTEKEKSYKQKNHLKELNIQFHLCAIKMFVVPFFLVSLWICVWNWVYYLTLFFFSCCYSNGFFFFFFFKTKFRFRVLKSACVIVTIQQKTHKSSTCECSTLQILYANHWIITNQENIWILLV